MKGFPKYFNTSQDVQVCLSDSNLAPQMKAKLQEWINNRFCWQVVGQVSAGTAGVADSTHQVETRPDGSQWQLAYVEDPNCQLFRLGYTVAEAQAVIASP